MTNRNLAETDEAIRLLTQANEARLREDYDASLKILMQAHRQFGESADLFALLAANFFNLASKPAETGENLQAAVDWMEKAVTLRPSDARLHAYLADYYWLGLLDYERAANEYRASIKLSPNHVHALVGGAALYGVPEEVVSLEEVTEWLETATQLEPDNPNYHFRLGEFYRLDGRYEECKREWSRALLCPQPLDPGPAAIVISFLNSSPQ